MKRKLFLMSLILMSVLGMSAQKSWNFSDAQWYSGLDSNGKVVTTDYTELTTIDGLTLTATAEKKMTVDNSKKTVDDVQYIARLKTGGAGNVDADGNIERTLCFDVDGPTSISVVVAHASSSGDARQLNFCAGTYDKNNPFATVEVAVGDPSRKTVEYVGPAKTIYLASANSGLNFYAIDTTPIEGDFYGIVGELTGGWDDDLVMTPTPDDPNVYTATVEGFKTGAKTYNYKLRKNFKWGEFEVPADGNCQYTFDAPGIYTLTFTANIANKTLECVAEKTANIEITSYSIVGELTGGWDNDVDMVQSEENPNIYTLNLDNFYSEGNKTYEYKLRANHEWGIYELPVSGNNTFTLNDAGYYNLTITANIAENTLDCQAVKLVILDNIAALKAYTDEGVVQVKLTDAKVTYSGVTSRTDSWGDVTETEHIIIEDATGGYDFQNIGVSASIIKGMTLNGFIEMQISTSIYGAQIVPTENTAAMFQALDKVEGTAEPLLVNDANWDEYAENYDWRYMRMEKIPLNIVAGSYGDDYVLGIEQMGEGGIGISDNLGLNIEDMNLTDGMVVDVEGYIINYYGLFYAFVPTSIVEHVDYYAIVGELTGGWPTDEAQTDVLMTRSEENENVYTLVVEGFEAFPRTYEYKLRTNYNWNEFVLPASGNNTYTFPELGVYTLTFTANIAENTLICEAVKTGDLDITFSVIGELTGGWDTDLDMVKSEENPNIFTAEVKNFYNEGDRTYEYKLRANHEWGIFEIPDGDSNLEFYLGDAGYYDLTFTANIVDNTLECQAVKLAILDNIAALKAYEGEGGDVKLQLTNAKVTYAGTFSEDDGFGNSYEDDYCVLEDETGAYMFNTIGMGKAFATGNVLNGLLELTINQLWGVNNVTANENTEASIATIEVTEGTVEPMVVNEENIDAYAENFDWKYVKFENVSGTRNESGEYYLNIPLFNDTYGCMDLFGVVTEWPADGEEVDAVGFLYDFMGGYSTFFQPISFEKKTANADVTVITFGNANPGRDYITDPFMVNGVTNLETDLKDGTHMLFNFESAGNPNGKFWAAAIAGEWNNSAAVAEMNEALNTGFENSDFAAGSALQATNPGPGDSHTNLILTFNDVTKKTLELYVTMTGRNGPLDEVTVTGLDNYIISYAVGSGDGFVSTPTFSQEILGVTLVKIQGYLIDGESVAVTSLSMAGENSAKNGFQLAGYTLTDEELPFVINSMAVVGTFPGMSWDPAEGIAMKQDAENAAIWTLKMEGVAVEAQQYEYKATANGKWGAYELPASGNQDFIFGTDEYPAGVYDLTFTADTAEGTLNFEAVKTPLPETVDIAVTDDVYDAEGYYRTFSSIYPLDFSDAEGIKAYTGKKNIIYDDATGLDLCEVDLTPIVKVPANTGILIKATEANVYTVKVATDDIDQVAENDLLVAAEKTDLFPLIDTYTKGIATLGHEVKTVYGLTVDALGFLSLPAPATEGVQFLEKGDVYITLDYDEKDQMYWNNDYAKLVFLDRELPIAKNIAALLEMPDGDATLKFAENTIVTFGNDSYIAIEDATGAMFIQNPGIGVCEGVVLSGEMTGTLNQSTLFPVLLPSGQTDLSLITVLEQTEPLNLPETTLEGSFEDNLNHRVVIRNLTLSVVPQESYGYSYNDYFVTDQNGAEIELSDNMYFLQEGSLDNLNDGDIVDLTGYAYIIPENSALAGYVDNLYQFQVATIDRVPVYSIVGDFCGEGEEGWSNDMDMTRSEEDPNVFTLVVNDFRVQAKTYEYKLRTDHQWGGYELPYEGNNNFVFGTPEYPAGVYNLTFVANVETHSLDLYPELKTATAITEVNEDWSDGNTYNLNGQRIDAPKKGVVIRNGKKIVVK